MKNNPLLRSPLFWVLFLTLSAIAGVGALQLYFKYAPNLNLEVTFSREQAIVAAEVFQKEKFPDLVTDRTAVVFVSDIKLQNYVELEAGGVAAYRDLIAQLEAHTHYWRVRNFTAGQEKELTTAFSPRGEPISFSLKIPDKEPGSALEESAARELALEVARKFIGNRFSQYQALSSTSKTQSTGRVDYSFIYEHQPLKVGEARFRLNINIAGDKLVAIDTFTHIPEAFGKRFEKMRSLNSYISNISSMLMLALFGIGGVVIGGVWLFRRDQLRWRGALYLASIISLGLGVSLICNLPMSWMGYKTTNSAEQFLLNKILMASGLAVVAGLAFAIIFSIGEAFTRIAFGRQPRLFDSFRLNAAASPEITGRVLGAYAWTGLFLLYALAFHLLATKVFGWWSPADTNTDPNILASWRPALAPIFNSLQAGTWEECVFRAVPLALAALIGARFNIRTPLIIFTLIAQALIFAGGHANYAQLPGYYRLVELFIPAMAFGLVYLRFGLLTCILTHFLYDLVLMSLPIFTADDASLWLDRGLVLLVGFAPLIVVLWARWKCGQFSSLPPEFLNSYQEETLIHAYSSIENTDSSSLTVGKAQASEKSLAPFRLDIRWMLPLSICAIFLIVFAFMQPLQINWQKYTVDRETAKTLAEQELKNLGVTLGEEWRSTIITQKYINIQHRFVWQELGVDKFNSLIGTYLDSHYWMMTWKKFGGPVEGRAEQWKIYLYPDGRLFKWIHTLPEAAEGKKLTREDALARSMEAISRKQWKNIDGFTVKAVEEKSLPNRTDWNITYTNVNEFNHSNSSAAIKVNLLGDEVGTLSQTIDVEDDWIRNHDKEIAQKKLWRTIGIIPGLLLVVIALIGLFRHRIKRKLALKPALPWIILNCVAIIVVSYYWRDQNLAALKPTMDWLPQVAMVIAGKWIQVSLVAILCFFMAQVIHAERPLAQANVQKDFLLGGFFALLVSGVYAAYSVLFELKNPVAAYSADFATGWPLITAVFNGFKMFFMPMLGMVIFIGIARFLESSKGLKAGIRRHRPFYLVMMLTLMYGAMQVLASRDIGNTIAINLQLFLFIYLAIACIRRQQLGVLIAMSGSYIALKLLNSSNALYDYAWLHGIISALFSFLVTYFLLKWWYKYSVS